MKSKRKNQVSRSLTSTLSIAFLALGVGVLLVSTMVQLYSSFQSQQAAIYSRQQLIAQDASKTVSNFFQEKFKVLETAADLTNPSKLSPDERQVTLDSLLGLQPAFRQLAFLDIKDKLSTSASRLSQVSSQPITQKLGKDGLTQLHQGNNYISSVYIDDATSEPLVIMAIPVTNVFGEFQGTLATEVNLKFMWDLVDQLKVGETGYAYVVDETGRLIAYKDTALVLKGESVSNIDEVDEFIKSLSNPKTGAPEVDTHLGLAGGSVIATYEPLGTPQWAVIVELPVQEAYQDITAQGTRSVLFILGVAILASLVGIYGARRLAAPLVELTNTANLIAGGELDLQATARGSSEVESLATAFNTMTSQLRNLIGSLEERIAVRTTDLEFANKRNERRAKQFEAIAQVARATATSQDIQTLLPGLVQLISEKFGFYHAGIFLLDENREFALLQAANSIGGKRMLQREHKLKVGQAGIVGYVTAIGTPRIALDVGDDAAFFNNPDLPSTRSEMALPLRIADEIVGALDVQSTEPNAFQQEDIEVLSTLADQVSIAIQNSRSYETTKVLLEEAKRVSSAYLSDTRQVLQKQEENLGYRISGNTLTHLEQPIISNQTSRAISSKQVVMEDGESATLAVPIRLRDEVIGVIDVRVPEEHEWEQDEVDIAEAVAERLSLALESAMLLKSTQRRAEIERVTADISSKIGSSTQFESILRIAAEELSRVLGDSEVLVQIQSIESSNGSENHKEK